MENCACSSSALAITCHFQNSRLNNFPSVRLRIPGLPTAALRQKIFRDTAWHASPSSIYCILVCCSRQIPDKCEAHPLTFKLLELWSLRKKTPVCNREESSSLDHNRMYWLYLYKTRWVSMCVWVRNWGTSRCLFLLFFLSGPNLILLGCKECIIMYLSDKYLALSLCEGVVIISSSCHQIPTYIANKI